MTDKFKTLFGIDFEVEEIDSRTLPVYLVFTRAGLYTVHMTIPRYEEEQLTDASATARSWINSILNP